MSLIKSKKRKGNERLSNTISRKRRYFVKMEGEMRTRVEMERWRDGEMERWRDGEIER